MWSALCRTEYLNANGHSTAKTEILLWTLFAKILKRFADEGHDNIVEIAIASFIFDFTEVTTSSLVQFAEHVHLHTENLHLLVDAFHLQSILAGRITNLKNYNL